MDQHLVSQFVIRNWADDDGRVEVFDLRRWGIRRDSPGSITYVASDEKGRGIVPPEFGLARETIEDKAAELLSD